MKTKKQPDGDFQCAVCTRFFPDRELFYEPEEEDAYMHQLLVRIRHIQDRVRDIYEQVCRAYIQDRVRDIYAKMLSLMEARAETLKLELTECLVNMASEFKRGEM
ncbi:hypothetical protein Tco_0034923 [Tanacetum coccineum]